MSKLLEAVESLPVGRTRNFNLDNQLDGVQEDLYVLMIKETPLRVIVLGLEKVGITVSRPKLMAFLKDRFPTIYESNYASRAPVKIKRSERSDKKAVEVEATPVEGGSGSSVRAYHGEDGARKARKLKNETATAVDVGSLVDTFVADNTRRKKME